MKRRALVIGSGGREHALAWALARSPSVGEVLVAPGNAGTRGGVIRSVEIASLDAGAIVALARDAQADLVVVGPEAPLCAGAIDALRDAGIDAFGPERGAAQLEASKAFTKRFCTRWSIPTAPYLVTSQIDEAEAYISNRGRAVVVKADGLAAGKGAVVTSTPDEAQAAARHMLIEGTLGDAGRTIVVEDRLEGSEMSVHALSDGERLFILPVSRDHKRVGDGDRGPNTGGMGALALLVVDAPLLERIEREVLRPTIEGMRADGHVYRGVLYAGLMIAPDGTPYLLEHNVRFGDPETQVLLPLLDGDVAELFVSVARGELDTSAVTLRPDRHAIVVVLAAAGYPESPRRGDAIRGIDDAAAIEGVHVFHAGTSRSADGTVVTAGGRVLGVGATGASTKEARERAYRGVACVHFDGMHFRRDIALAAP